MVSIDILCGQNLSPIVVLFLSQLQDVETSTYIYVYTILWIALTQSLELFLYNL